MRDYLTVKDLKELEEQGINVPEYRYMFAEIREGATDEEVLNKWAGAKIYFAKIDEVTKHRIFEAYKSGIKIRDIARKFKVTESFIYNVVKRKRKELLEKKTQTRPLF